jgi:hypothetical protein
MSLLFRNILFTNTLTPTNAATNPWLRAFNPDGVYMQLPDGTSVLATSDLVPLRYWLRYDNGEMHEVQPIVAFMDQSAVEGDTVGARFLRAVIEHIAPSVFEDAPAPKARPALPEHPPVVEIVGVNQDAGDGAM